MKVKITSDHVRVYHLVADAWTPHEASPCKRKVTRKIYYNLKIPSDYP